MLTIEMTMTMVNIRLGPGRSGQRFLFGFPLFPTQNGGGGVPLCEPINEPQGPAVKFRRLQWIWAVCGRGAPKSWSPFPLLPLLPPLRCCHTLSLSLSLSLYIYIYICISIYIYIESYQKSLSMHKPYHSSPRRRCTPISCESKSPRPGIMSSSQHTAGQRRTTRSV